MKVYDREAVDVGQVLFAAGLNGYLRGRDFPVAGLIETKESEALVEVGRHLFQMYEFVAGEVFRPGNEAQVDAAGSVLGRMHGTGAGAPIPEGMGWTPLYGAVLRELEACWDDLKREGGVEDELDRLQDFLEGGGGGAGWEELPVSVVHGDYRAQNLVYRKDRVVAVLDLDGARPAPRLWDVAYGLMFFQAVLAEGPLSKEEMAAFLRGYNREAGLTGAERAMLSEVLRMALLKGLTLWMRIAYLDRVNARAKGWIRAYWPLLEQVERGEMP